MAATRPTSAQLDSMSNTQKAAAAVSIVFALVGILGFIPGVTSNYDEMKFAGHESGAELLGIFQVSILHNLVHLGFGIAGLVMVRSFRGARTYLLGGGFIYLALWVYGLLVEHDATANFVPFNNADDLLHLGLGIGMISLGYLVPRTESATTQR